MMLIWVVRLYLILIVTELLFRERPDSEVNCHGLLLSTTGDFTLGTKKTTAKKTETSLSAKGWILGFISAASIMSPQKPGQSG